MLTRRTGSPGAAAFAFLVLSGCPEEAAPPGLEDDEQKELNTTGNDTDTETEGDGSELQPGANVCLAAAPVGAGVFRSDLEGKDSNNGGACERGGPDVFFKVDVPIRADVSFQALAGRFEPRVGVRHSDCTASFDDRGLLCAEGIPGWITDVAAGTQLIVSVGMDADDPARVEGGPLPFDLEVGLRPVLALGDRCEPETVGRCEIGTQCVTQYDDFGGSLGPATCVRIEGDTCQSALPFTVRAGSTLIGIPRDAPHSDAHQHSCGGARSRERVLRIELADPLGLEAQVRVEGGLLNGLAVRGPGCLPHEELACGVDGGAVVVDSPPSSFYVFAELPLDSGDGEEPPYAVRILFEPG